ncbi:MAG TPA: hypothetical protein PLX23_01705, partial [Candidatus Hydrogenedens sp.]|nr:hypothetical protein [Candidatus Hydrogenedens sp.]
MSKKLIFWCHNLNTTLLLSAKRFENYLLILRQTIKYLFSGRDKYLFDLFFLFLSEINYIKGI